MTRPPRLPLRWYFAMTRLLAARLLERATSERGGQAFALLGLAMAIKSGIGYERAQVPDQLALLGSGQPVASAFAVWIIQLAIMVVAAILAYALRPKPKDPEVVKAQVPVVEDGKGIIKIYGTVWVDDSIVLGWKQMGTIKIKAQGGKKG